MATSDLIKQLQSRVGADPDGIYGPGTHAKVMAALDAAGAKPAPKKTVADFIGGFIDAHEGGLSMDPADNGNWTGGKRNAGTLVGSKFGVTAGALALYRGVGANTITAKDISTLDRDTAVKIGVRLYYEVPKFNLLPFNRVTLSVVDKGWGSGPKQAIKLVQRLVGVADDGIMGPATAQAFADYIARHGEEYAARHWADVRIAFDTSLNQPRFIKGWNNRTNSFLPGTAWWAAWA